MHVNTRRLTVDTTLRKHLAKTRQLRNQVESMLLGDEGDVVEAELKKFVTKRPCWIPSKDPVRAQEAMIFLVPCGTHTVTLTARHDPDAFYKTHEGLWVYDGFRNLIVAKAKPCAAGMAYNVAALELTHDLTDAEIETSLGGGHPFDETEVCAIIAVLIENQPKGKGDVLINNGYANLFYTSSCVVSVRWHAGNRSWHVGTWRRDDHRWNAGDRVFSRN